MGRRAKGTDSVYKRKSTGRWFAQVTDPLSGKRIYRAATPNTKAAASALLEEMRQRQKAGQPLPNEQLTVAAYFEDWLSKKPNDHLKASSLKRYGELIRCHIIPALGRESLARLSVPQTEEFYRQQRAQLKPATLRAIRGVLHTALQDALRLDLVLKNVADIAQLPKEPRAKGAAKPKPLSPQEADKLLEAAKRVGDRFEALFWLAVSTGMREGELLALCWQDVHLDAEAPSLQVRYTLAHVHGPQFETPKSAASERTNLLFAPAVEALRRHRVRQNEERLRKGAAWGDGTHDLVFPNTLGRPQHPGDFLADHFSRLLQKAELPSIKFHTLRHTAISWLLSQGVPPLDVAAYVGHADAAITLKVYAHPLQDSQQKIVEAMERAFTQR